MPFSCACERGSPSQLRTNDDEVPRNWRIGRLVITPASPADPPLLPPLPAPKLPSVGMEKELVSGRRLRRGLNEPCMPPVALGVEVLPPLVLAPLPDATGSIPSAPDDDTPPESIGLLSAVLDPLRMGPTPERSPPLLPVARRLPIDMPKPETPCCSLTVKVTTAVAILVGCGGGGRTTGSFGVAPG